MDQISVAIADDHILFCEGLRALLANDSRVQLVGEASSGEEALQLVSKVHPQILLLDYRMPGKWNGLQAIPHLLQASPSTRIVMLSMYDDRERVIEALRSGASGYVLKSSRPPELFAAIRAAADNDWGLCPDVARKLVSHAASRGHVRLSRADLLRDGLTGREKETLQSVVHGLTNQQIARKHFISESAVRQHLSRIFDKMNVSGRAQAAAQAVSLGLASVASDEDEAVERVS